MLSFFISIPDIFTVSCHTLFRFLISDKARRVGSCALMVAALTAAIKGIPNGVAMLALDIVVSFRFTKVNNPQTVTSLDDIE